MVQTKSQKAEIDTQAETPATELNVWGVTVPIAGHAYIEVVAATEEEAIEKAMCNVTSAHLENWEALEQFNQGNVCYCPHPWDASAVDLGPDDNSVAEAS